MRKLPLLSLLFVFSMQACLEQEDPNAEVNALLEKQDAQILQHLESQNLEAEKDQYGVYVMTLENAPAEGAVAVSEGDVAEVTYRLTQLDGTLIGTNEGGETMRMALDKNTGYAPIYSYFALKGMKVGEKKRFYLPFSNAYGNFSIPNLIPSRGIVVMELEVNELHKGKDALLAADIELIESALSAAGKDADTLNPSGIRKLVLSEGMGEVAGSGDQVSVYYTGKFLNGLVFDTNTGASGKQYTFTIGAQGANQPITGFETALKSMKEGEKAVFYIPSAQAYGSRGVHVAPMVVRENLVKQDPGRYTIAPHSPLVFELELVKVTKGN